MTYFITQFFYAGLRFQVLNLFAINVFALLIINSHKINLSKKSILYLFLVALLAVSFRLKNFHTESGLGLSPFAPYHFYWEQPL
jgi:hypothetical protein